MSFRVPKKGQLRFSEGNKTQGFRKMDKNALVMNDRTDKNIIARPKMNLQSFKLIKALQIQIA